MVTDISRIELILKEEFVYGNKVKLLHSGQVSFDTIFRSLESAEQIICLEFYIYRNDDTGIRLAGILKKKASEGVAVYLLYDHYGSFQTPDSFWNDLMGAGINVRASHPFTWRDRHEYFRRDHKKLIVIDGRRAFTGGLNIANEYSGGHFYKRSPLLKREKLSIWRDTGVLIEGPVALNLFRLFRKAWYLWHGDEIKFNNKETSSPGSLPIIPIFASSPRGSRRLRRLINWSISNSKKSIHITTAYFTPSLRMLKGLRRAAEKGVDVRIIIPGTSDIPAANYAAHAAFTRLLQSGVQIYEYSGVMLHAKTYLFDGIWSIIGSANLDFQSLRKNDEGNVGILDEEFGEKMLNLFRSDMADSDAVSLKRWLNRPFTEKIKEAFFSIFRKSL